MIWLYALTDDPEAPLPAIAGHGDARLDQTSVHELAGVWSDAPRTRAPASAQAGLWRQEAVLEALMARRSVLPIRYGTVVEDPAAVERMISVRLVQWREALGRVRECVEMAVRAGAGSSSTLLSPGRESGTQYLNRRGREYADARALTEAVHTRLATMSRASEAKTSIDAPRQLTASYLVPRAALEQFSHAVAELTAREPELSISCTGPWPPYSFVQPGGATA